MLRLHGAPMSSHYNKAKLALLEKGIQFEEVMTMPAQDETVLKYSPIGKIPWIEVDGTGVAAYLQRLQQRPAVQKVAADRDKAFAAFMASKKG